MDAPKNSDDQKELWKKYLRLIDEQKKIEHQHFEKEQLLRDFMGSLLTAMLGVDQQLDSHLVGIRNRLRDDELDISALRNDFKSFNRAFSSAKQHNKNVKTQELTLESAKIDVQLVSKKLLFLVETMEIPNVFENQTQSTKELLSTRHSEFFDFESTLNSTIDLLVKIKAYNRSEQQEIDQFLAHITEQLAHLGSELAEANKAAVESAATRDKFDKSVSEQIQFLQNNSHNALTLDALKSLIDKTIVHITNEVHEQQRREMILQEKAQEKLRDLTQKLKRMEAESDTLKSKLKEASIQAFHDALTGLPNRHSYNERISIELARTKRYKEPLSLLIWDIDYFKKINDTFGHRAGDRVLILIARRLFENCRNTDFVCRFGGEEFVMLLPHTDKECALILAQQLRDLIEKTAFNANGNAVPITVSCGITQFLQNDSHETAFERADKALYEAKESGRNRCCIK